MADRFDVDAASGWLAVRTRAVGLFSRVAHDLEIASPTLRGHVILDGDAWTADLTVAVNDFDVVGVLRHGKVDRTILSKSDSAEIDKRMRELFNNKPGATSIRIEATGSSRTRGEATVSSGDDRSRVTVVFGVRTQADALVVTGTSDLSLHSLGLPEVKGPLGAFKVADRVEVLFDLTLRPAPVTPTPAP